MAFGGGLLERKKVVQVQQEAVKGTFIEAALVDMFCFDPKIESTAEWIERKGSGVAMGHTELGMFGDELGVFSARIEMRGNGTNELDAALTLVMQACGFTVAAGVYSPSATIAAQKTLSIVQHDDGVKKALSGCMGTIVFSGEQGNPVFAEVEMFGRYAAPSDDANPGYTPSAEVPPIMGSGVMTLDALLVLINTFSVDMGNVVEFRAGTSTALQHYVITDRNPVIAMDPEQDLLAGYSYDSIRRARTTKAFTLGTGTGAGKLITYAAPLVQNMALPSNARGGLLSYDYTGICVAGATGNDEFTVTVPVA